MKRRDVEPRSGADRSKYWRKVLAGHTVLSEKNGSTNVGCGPPNRAVLSGAETRISIRSGYYTALFGGPVQYNESLSQRNHF